METGRRTSWMSGGGCDLSSIHLLITGQQNDQKAEQLTGAGSRPASPSASSREALAGGRLCGTNPRAGLRQRKLVAMAQ